MQSNFQSGRLKNYKKKNVEKQKECTVLLKYLNPLKKKVYNFLSNFVTYFRSPGVETPVNVHTMGCELN